MESMTACEEEVRPGYVSCGIASFMQEQSLCNLMHQDSGELCCLANTLVHRHCLGELHRHPQIFTSFSE